MVGQEYLSENALKSMLPPIGITGLTVLLFWLLPKVIGSYPKRLRVIGQAILVISIWLGWLFSLETSPLWSGKIQYISIFLFLAFVCGIIHVVVNKNKYAGVIILECLILFLISVSSTAMAKNQSTTIIVWPNNTFEISISNGGTNKLEIVKTIDGSCVSYIDDEKLKNMKEVTFHTSEDGYCGKFQNISNKQNTRKLSAEGILSGRVPYLVWGYKYEVDK